MLSYLHAMLFRRAVLGRGKPKSAAWRSEAPGARSRPAFDCLEDRTVPSTLGTQVASLAGQAATLTQDALTVDHGLYFLDGQMTAQGSGAGGASGSAMTQVASLITQADGVVTQAESVEQQLFFLDGQLAALGQGSSIPASVQAEITGLAGQASSLLSQVNGLDTGTAYLDGLVGGSLGTSGSASGSTSVTIPSHDRPAAATARRADQRLRLGVGQRQRLDFGERVRLGVGQRLRVDFGERLGLDLGQR
jgi:hypothetical protein